MPDPLPLGAFSLSLTVKDLGASRAFYQALGFSDSPSCPLRKSTGFVAITILTA
jgi:predicted lactoylglutathione lyase